MHSWLLSLQLLFFFGSGIVQEPTAQALLERFAKEKSPVWVDGDTATFFYRGEAEQVTLIVGGDQKPLQRLPQSDVWTTTVTKPGMAQGVLTYFFLAGKKRGDSVWT